MIWRRSSTIRAQSTSGDSFPSRAHWSHGLKFWLGTHQVDWLSKVTVPLFVSARRLRQRKSLPRATCPWVLDSGGFSELSLYGQWKTPPEQYASEAMEWQDRIGGLEWAAPQDWMCEPVMLEKTGLTIAEHQIRSVASYLYLRVAAASVPWAPVLQGWLHQDYLEHFRMYERCGVDLASLPVVGLGSVCRRQALALPAEIIRDLSSYGLRLHGFGFKMQGVAMSGHLLHSADSMAWSFDARRSEPLPGCSHKNCANCLKYALRWRYRLLSQ